MNIFYKTGYKYQLVREYTTKTCIKPDEDVHHDFFEIDSTGLLTIRIGYAWNGANWPAFDTRTIMEPSLVHDVGCQAIMEGLLPRSHKACVDREFYKRCVASGMWRARAWWAYKAVIRFSCTGKPKLVHSAPDAEAVHINTEGVS